MAIPSTTLAVVESLYVGYFNRAGDPAGVNSWVNALNTGKASFTSIASLFSTSAEAQALYPYLAAPAIASPTVFITSVYQNLFNRPPEAAGLSFWTAYLNSSVLNNSNSAAVGNFISTVMQSAAAGSQDNLALQNKATVAADFSQQVVNSGLSWSSAAGAQSLQELAAVSSDPATVVSQGAATTAWVAAALVPAGTTYTLTTGVDTISGGAGNDTIVGVLSDTATANTLTAFDSINGGGSTNTLQTSGSMAGGDVLPAGATITNGMTDLLTYIKKEPSCPSGGTYTLGTVIEKPRCSIPGHTR